MISRNQTSTVQLAMEDRCDEPTLPRAPAFLLAFLDLAGWDESESADSSELDNCSDSPTDAPELCISSESFPCRIFVAR